MRDDFTQATKDKLANRAGWRCSNPNCEKPTRGAGNDENTYINVGVAAHICAASKGGPRYNWDMTAEERKADKNGIWLCQYCAKLIDSDVNRYTVEKLNMWKEESEKRAAEDLENTNISRGKQRCVLTINSYFNIDKNAVGSQEVIIDLTKYFEDRFLKAGYGWEDIVNEMKSRISLYLNKECQYLVKLTTHFSVAFIAGRIMNTKSGIESIPVQRTVNGGEIWNISGKKDITYEELSFRKDTICDNNYDIAFVVSITRNIENAVNNYIKDAGLLVREICYCSLEMPSIDSVKDGHHAWVISKQLNNWIQEYSSINRKGSLHIFFSGPISIMFYLGKMSLAYGKGKIYEFDLENKRYCTYYPALNFTEEDWMEV